MLLVSNAFLAIWSKCQKMPAEGWSIPLWPYSSIFVQVYLNVSFILTKNISFSQRYKDSLSMSDLTSYSSPNCRSRRHNLTHNKNNNHLKREKERKKGSGEWMREKRENVTSFPCYKNECFLAEKCLRWKDRGVVFAVGGCLYIYWKRLSTV